MDTLGAAITAFIGSALFVIAAGMGLARFGDELAEKTGWGKLWVGTLLVGIATSLPEVTVNVSAVWLEKSPGLALGNVFGANMLNLFVLGLAAVSFGVGKVFGNQGNDTRLLILTGVALVAVALAFGVVGDVKLGPTSLAALVIFGGYIMGMRLVYKAGRTDMDLEDIPPVRGSARNAWIGFGACVLVVIIAGRFLASSADAIAEASGISASFVGVLLVSIVTTLPEGSVTMAACFRKSYGIAMGNVYGSCAFNVTIISIADLFHDGPLLGAMEPAHFAAGAAAFVLMGMGFLIFRGSQAAQISAAARGLAYFMPGIYVAALYLVFTLGQR
jgi:cation:H+ antiporter